MQQETRLFEKDSANARARRYRWSRDVAGFLAIGCLLAAYPVWVQAGEAWCHNAVDSPDCPLTYDSGQIRQRWFAVGLVVAGIVFAVATAVLQYRFVSLGGDRLILPRRQRADMLMLAGAGAGAVGYALGRFGIHESQLSLPLGWAAAILASLGILLAGASLFVKPTSGITQRWAAVLAVALGALGVLYGWLIIIFSEL